MLEILENFVHDMPELAITQFFIIRLKIDHYNNENFVILGNSEFVLVIFGHFRIVKFRQILEYLSGSVQIRTEAF